MPRAKNRVASRARRKKVLESAKGFYGRRKSNLRLAKEAVDHAGQNSYQHRRDRRGDFRSLWIQRINAAVRLHGMSYSVFMGGMAKTGIELNRKVLADMAINDADAFASIVEQVKAAA